MTFDQTNAGGGRMRYTIVGAGAIGGTLGAYMARAGEDVTFVDADRAHVAAMRERGLTIRGYKETFTVPARAFTPEEAPGPVEALLLAVKAQHTEAALGAIVDRLAPDGFVVSLQNGLCEDVIRQIVGAERTVGCFVNFSADYLEPGLVHYGSEGALYLGELDGAMSDRLQALGRAFAHWGPVRLTDNIWGYLWAKMGYANMLFMTATVDATMADVIDRYRPLAAELAAEIYDVAEREGVRLEAFDAIDPSMYHPRGRDPREVDASFDRLTAWQRTSEKQKSGIWRDLAVRHRPTEVDVQIGRAALIGARHGLAMPLTRRLVDIIHDLEQGRRAMSWDNVEELERLRRGEGRA
jgi:2-dehydropantoate 2-reductase